MTVTAADGTPVSTGLSLTPEGFSISEILNEPVRGRYESWNLRPGRYQVEVFDYRYLPVRRDTVIEPGRRAVIEVVVEEAGPTPGPEIVLRVGGGPPDRGNALTVAEAAAAPVGTELTVHGPLTRSQNGVLRLCTEVLDSLPPSCAAGYLVVQGVDIEALPGVIIDHPTDEVYVDDVFLRGTISAPQD